MKTKTLVILAHPNIGKSVQIKDGERNYLNTQKK